MKKSDVVLIVLAVLALAVYCYLLYVHDVRMDIAIQNDIAWALD